MNTYRIIETEVIRMAEGLKVIPQDTATNQATGALHNVGALLEAASAIDTLKKLGVDHNEVAYVKAKQGYKEAVGQLVIDLVIGCALVDVDMVECFDEAYKKQK